MHSSPTLLTLASIFFCGALFANEPKPDVSPLISQTGELVFEDDFDSSEFKPEWVGLHGTRWSVVDGALRGEPSTEEYQQKQIAKNNRAHSGKSPSSRLMVGVDDCVVLFRFKMAENLAGAHFGFNDGKTGTQHVGRFTVTTKTGMTLQKDKNPKIKGDKDETLVTNEFNVEADTWYWMMLEVVGEEMVAQVSGGPVLKAQHPRLGIYKGQINLPTRGGGVIYFDHVRVWKAIPQTAAE